MNLMSPLLLTIIVFLVSWIDWFIYGKKGMALLNRSPWLIFWSCLEVILGAIMGYGLYDAYNSRDIMRFIFVLIAAVIGCAIGCATSGVVQRKKE
jgi:hypothetical protein